MKALNNAPMIKPNSGQAGSAPYLYAASFLICLVVLTGSTIIRKPDPLAAFQQVASRLAALKTVKYQYLRELNYPAENYLSKIEGEMYIDFARNNDIAGFRYQYHDAAGFDIFNNSEAFTGNTKAKTIRVTHKVKSQNLESKSALYNSLVTLRRILPAVIKDESIVKIAGDTVLNNTTYQLLTFVLQSKTINYTGSGFTPTTVPLTFTYRLIVDKTNGLPLTLLQTKKNSQDLNRTDFLNIDTKPSPPAESSWYYSTYLKDYQLYQDKPVSIIAPGQAAPAWELTNYISNKKETLEKYKGKIVLLEFWIRNCGYCIAAVSPLNELSEKFKADEFQVLALNTEDSAENIKLFAARNKVKYTILHGDNPDLNKNYGIGAFPLVVLLDKEGKVIYSGGLEVDKLIPLIDKNIM